MEIEKVLVEFFGSLEVSGGATVELSRGQP